MLSSLVTASIGSAAVKSTVQVPAMLLEAIILKVVASAGILLMVSFIMAAMCLKDRALRLSGFVTLAYIGPLLLPL